MSLDDVVEMNDMSQPPLNQQIELQMNASEQVDEKDYVNVEHGFGLGIEDEDKEMKTWRIMSPSGRMSIITLILTT